MRQRQWLQVPDLIQCLNIYNDDRFMPYLNIYSPFTDYLTSMIFISTFLNVVSPIKFPIQIFDLIGNFDCLIPEVRSIQLPQFCFPSEKTHLNLFGFTLRPLDVCQLRASFRATLAPSGHQVRIHSPQKYYNVDRFKVFVG